MKISRYYKYRLYPNASQRAALAKMFGNIRFVVNRSLEAVLAKIDDDGYHFNYNEEANDLTDLKADFPFLKDAESTSLQQSLKHVGLAVKRYFMHLGGKPNYVSKKHRQSMTICAVKNNIKIVDDRHIRLPKLENVRFVYHRPLPSESRITSVCVSKEVDGRFFVSMHVEFNRDILNQPLNFDNAVGLDYKSDGLYVSSDGVLASMPHYFRKAQWNLKQKQKRLSRTKLGSKNHEKARVKAARATSRVADCRKDFLSKASHELVETYDIVSVEDIDMRSMKRSLKLGKATSDNGYGAFRKMLEYKLNDRGKALVKVDRFFASSQMCHACGHKDPITKDLSVREWDCPVCGNHNDRDLNAALNIRDEGLRILRSNTEGHSEIEACGETPASKEAILCREVPSKQEAPTSNSIRN
jgi:putative transposase